MSIARQIADFLDSGGDLKTDVLDNVPASDWNTILNKPSHKDVDMTSASNFVSGTVNPLRLGTGTGSSSTYLRGDGQWVTNCTAHSNCSSPSTGTITTGTGTVTGVTTGSLVLSSSGTTITISR